MAIQNVGAATAQPGAGQALTTKTVTQDDFLKLLIAQLQNQNPLQPMDNQQFAAQLATFNSLGQLIDIDKKLGEMQSVQSLTNQFNAASLIGKEVTADGNLLNLSSGSPTAIGYELSANAAKVVVKIYNASGGLVRQLEAGSQTAGSQSISWDGKDASGQSAPAGFYHFDVAAFDAAGKSVAAAGEVRGIVTGVRMNGSEPLLEIGAMSVPLSSVFKVRSQG